ncbi:hypothetical protein Pmar_PMAR026515 [Perkinsus marinus ATCC 50983]|uniref:Uncharacterized protein n=1 Tax=Perkinsus marinus (strain ATCC 50983 / TXsc) TaxID=423536 RepID=C5LDR7_PERM5|nr:hypothetical protein Pmar_PMAR026515 [Perkinsus marinus ATCC 50983]EER05081.1 hypothetical protein Pmar_PMAR026515 [Perkinsus marinus ATCC 50983]|eukprot:XP_002773265.1 hypothetical protein Pmar_PMAR026515 [Perkinsus marinus ATCC 50983]
MHGGHLGPFVASPARPQKRWPAAETADDHLAHYPSRTLYGVGEIADGDACDERSLVGKLESASYWDQAASLIRV